MESISTQAESANNSRDYEEIQIIINQNDDDITNNQSLNVCLQRSIITIITISTCLVISLDLYIAFTDNNCIIETMKIYLIVSSIFILVLLSIYVFNKNIIRIIISNHYFLFSSIYIYTFIFIGYALCTTLGAIIYWNIIDKNKCSSFVNNYLYTILIIKIIGAFYLLYNKFFIL